MRQSSRLTWEKRKVERVCERVEEILNTHQPEPLPDEIVAKLDAIIRRVEENGDD